MRNLALASVLLLFLSACASQGQKGAEIEQRDLFDEQKAAQPAQDSARQQQIAKEQEELKRQLEEQQRRQQGQQDQAIVRPLTDSGVGGTQIKGDAWSQLKEPGSVLAKRSIYYDFDSYSIKEEYVPVIDAHSKLLTQHTDLRIAVQGNCDDRGSREYNLALGQRRSEAVRRALELLGVRDSQVEAVSFGKEKPAVQGSDENAWAQNRRAEIVYR